MREVGCAGQAMDDGKGVLEDGTRYVRESGEDFGPNGFWKRWTRLAGVSAQGKVRPAAPHKLAEMSADSSSRALDSLSCHPLLALSPLPLRNLLCSRSTHGEI